MGMNRLRVRKLAGNRKNRNKRLDSETAECWEINLGRRGPKVPQWRNRKGGGFQKASSFIYERKAKGRAIAKA